MLPRRSASIVNQQFREFLHLRRDVSNFLPLRRPQRCQYRLFHASRPRQMDISTAVETLISPSHYILISIHSVGLPWFAAIPAGAFLARLLFLFVSEIPAAKRKKYLHECILPVGLARQPQIAKEMRARMITETFDRSKIKEEIEKAVRKDGEEVMKRFGADSFGKELVRFVGLQIGQLAVFLSMAETVRRLSGARNGLLGMIAERWKKGVPEETAPSVPRESPVQGLDEAISQQPAATYTLPMSSIATTDAVDAVATSPTVTTSAVEPHAWFDPSMASEGFLWFTDLCASDPTLYALPVLVCSSMIYNIRLSNNMKPLSELGIGVKLLSLATLGMGYLILKFPAAVLFYWFSSQFFLAAGRILVRRWCPIPDTPKLPLPPVKPFAVTPRTVPIKKRRVGGR